MNIRCFLTALCASEKLLSLLKLLSGISDLANCPEVLWSCVLAECVHVDEMVTTTGCST